MISLSNDENDKIKDFRGNNENIAKSTVSYLKNS